jgi:hypothetical protein
MDKIMKLWTKPVLMVVLRNNPEESVIGACKQWMSHAIVGYRDENSGCLYLVGVPCTFCSGNGQS